MSDNEVDLMVIVLWICFNSTTHLPLSRHNIHVVRMYMYSGQGWGCVSLPSAIRCRTVSVQCCTVSIRRRYGAVRCRVRPSCGAVPVLGTRAGAGDLAPGLGQGRKPHCTSAGFSQVDFRSWNRDQRIYVGMRLKSQKFGTTISISLVQLGDKKYAH